MRFAEVGAPLGVLKRFGQLSSGSSCWKVMTNLAPNPAIRFRRYRGYIPLCQSVRRMGRKIPRPETSSGSGSLTNLSHANL